MRRKGRQAGSHVQLAVETCADGGSGTGTGPPPRADSASAGIWGGCNAAFAPPARSTTAFGCPMALPGRHRLAPRNWAPRPAHGCPAPARLFHRHIRANKALVGFAEAAFFLGSWTAMPPPSSPLQHGSLGTAPDNSHVALLTPGGAVALCSKRDGHHASHCASQLVAGASKQPCSLPIQGVRGGAAIR